MFTDSKEGQSMINSINRTATIGTDTTMISEAKINGHSERVRLVVTNTSAGGQVISLAVNADATAGSGLVLSPGGFMTWERQGNVPVQQQRVNAISNLAGGSVAIYEEVLQ